MLKSKLKWIVCACLVILLNACVTTPTNGEWVSPHDRITFGGLGNVPRATIEIQAYHWNDDRWITVATARTAASSNNIGGDLMYSWNTHVEFTSIPNWQCFWSNLGSCSIPAGSASARLRAIQVSDDRFTMVVFEKDFSDCLGQRFEQGEGALVAGYNCRSQEDPDWAITLKWLT